MTPKPPAQHLNAPDPGAVAPLLLAWYAKTRRELPWRMPPGVLGDAYRIWLSEVMLQQTTVKAVLPYYRRFLERWPTVRDLAAANRDDVLSLWAGLGYYSRANNLHLCAQRVVKLYDGKFPSTEAELLTLPGIGPYTAAAIAAMAFGEPTTPVDGNIERVVARLYSVDIPLPESKNRLRELAATLTPENNAGDFAQAMMDLGATVCTPKRPSCMICPLERMCGARGQGRQAELPARAIKPARPVRRGIAFVALREDGHVLLRKRPHGGLLSNMMEVPSTEWREATSLGESAPKTLPVRARWTLIPGLVVHTFTHFRLELVVQLALVPADASLTLWAEPERCRWVARRDLATAALPSVMRKIIAHALDDPANH